MNDAYRALMGRQCMPEESKQAMINNLLQNQERNSRPFYLTMANMAMCILLMIPITVLAVDSIFGISIVEIVRGNTTTNKFETGYEVNYPGIARYQLSDFSEEIRTMEDYRLVAYDTWQQAEEALGITLMNNTFLFDKSVTKARTYNLKGQGIPDPVHCFTEYNGLDNQFYRAIVRAAYHYHDTHITIHCIVTCDHPAISDEDASGIHSFRVMHNDYLVEDISQEQYLASNGINATIITVDRGNRRAAEYTAVFFANRASYKITVMSKYDGEHAAEAKENLIEILEGFVF